MVVLDRSLNGGLAIRTCLGCGTCCWKESTTSDDRTLATPQLGVEPHLVRPGTDDGGAHTG